MSKKLVKKGGKLLKKNGKLVVSGGGCTCCGECDGTCNPDNNPLTRCASAALTCFQNDCEPEPGFPECVDYTRPDTPDSGSLKAIIKAQGYDVVIDDSKTHPEGCCDCDDVNHFTVWGCCYGTIITDERFVRTALQKQGAPCETCVPRGDGIEAGVDASGNPVWRVFECRNVDPPCFFCDENAPGGIRVEPLPEDACLAQGGFTDLDLAQETCKPVVSCDSPLPSSMDVSFGTPCLSDKFTLPLVLRDPARPGEYVVDTDASGGLVVGGVDSCEDGAWRVSFGTNLFSPDFGPCIDGTVQRLKCGDSWAGALDGGGTGTITLNCEDAPNPLP